MIVKTFCLVCPFNKEQVWKVEGCSYNAQSLEDRRLLNRFLVKSPMFDKVYEDIQAAVEGIPIGAPLPRWLRGGELPQVDSQDWEQFGEALGMHEIEEGA